MCYYYSGLMKSWWTTQKIWRETVSNMLIVTTAFSKMFLPGKTIKKSLIDDAKRVRSGKENLSLLMISSRIGWYIIYILLYLLGKRLYMLRLTTNFSDMFCWVRKFMIWIETERTFKVFHKNCRKFGILYIYVKNICSNIS